MPVTSSRSAVSSRRTVRLWHTLALGLILVLAVFARVRGLGTRELWFDEVCTHYVVHYSSDWPDDGPDLRREVAHRPYFYLLRLWTRLAGEDAWGLRSFSAVAGCVGIAALGLISLGVGGRSVGLIAVAIAAVHPLHVYYSQEARVYALWSLEAVVCLYALHKAASKLNRRWWVTYAVIAWISVATHYYTLLWLPATLGGVFVSPDKRRFLKQWLWTNALLAVCLAPLILIFVVPLGKGGPKPWLAEIWSGYPPALAIPRSLWALLPSGGYPEYLGTLPVAFARERLQGNWWMGAVTAWGPVVLVAGLVLLSLRRKKPGGGEDLPQETRKSNRAYGASHRECLAFLTTTTLGFLAIAWLYSWLVAPMYVVGRYDFFAWPAAVIAVALLVEAAGRCLSARPARGVAVRVILTGLFIMAGGATVVAAHQVPASHSAAERERAISERVGSDDLVVSLGMYRWFMSYEWISHGFSAGVVSFPRRHAQQLCWSDAEAELADRDEIRQEASRLVGEIATALRRNRRVWLLAQGAPSGPRWKVDKMLYDQLQRGGFEIEPAVDWLGLARVVRRSDGQ